MELLFKEEFRPACYKLALQYKQDGKRNNNVTSTTPVRVPQSEGSVGGTSEKGSPESQGSVGHESSMGTAKRSLSVVPQYNICESYLNADTFVDVLQICRVMVSTFDEALSKRLIMAHGADPRIKEEVLENQVVQDFKWIFAKRGAQKPSFKSGSIVAVTAAPTSTVDDARNRGRAHSPFHQEIAPVKPAQFSLSRSTDLQDFVAPASGSRSTPVPLSPLKPPLMKPS
jgi:hypothetical protein